MIDDLETIKKVLSEAENIYSMDGESRIMLVYSNCRLVANSDFGLVYKPIEDVARITFNYDLEAWEVIWKV